MSDTVNPLASEFSLTVKAPDGASSKMKAARRLGIQILCQEQLKRNMETKKQTEVEWAGAVGCDDKSMGRIGLFSLLRLISAVDGGWGYVCIHKDTPSTILFALNEADPKMKHWAVTDHGDFIKVWRRKEYNESIEKQQVDEVKKAATYADEADFQADKKTVIDFFLEAFDGNQKLANAMFMPLANNREALRKRAAAMRAVRGK